MSGEVTPERAKPVAGAAPAPIRSSPPAVTPAPRPQPAPAPMPYHAGLPEMTARGSVPGWFWPVVGLVVVLSAGVAVFWRFVLN